MPTSSILLKVPPSLLYHSLTTPHFTCSAGVHVLQPASTEPQVFCKNFRCHLDDMCTFVSVTGVGLVSALHPNCVLGIGRPHSEQKPLDLPPHCGWQVFIILLPGAITSLKRSTVSISEEQAPLPSNGGQWYIPGYSHTYVLVTTRPCAWPPRAVVGRIWD